MFAGVLQTNTENAAELVVEQQLLSGEQPQPATTQHTAQNMVDYPSPPSCSTHLNRINDFFLLQTEVEHEETYVDLDESGMYQVCKLCSSNFAISFKFEFEKDLFVNLNIEHCIVVFVGDSRRFGGRTEW